MPRYVTKAASTLRRKAFRRLCHLATDNLQEPRRSLVDIPPHLSLRRADPLRRKLVDCGGRVHHLARPRPYQRPRRGK